MQDFVYAVRAAPASEFWFWTLVLAGFTLLAIKATITRLRRAHIVADIPTSRARSAAQGYVELQGTGRLLPGPPNVAPLSGRNCCWWSFRVQQKVVRRRGGRTEVSWKTISSGSSEEPFLLEDDTGSCVVDPWGAEVLAASRERWFGNSHQPTPKMRRRRYGGDYRYSEQRLEIGDPLYIIGWFRTERDNPENTPIDDEVRELLAQWKRDQPRLLQRFDQNRDGSIDLGEWEMARRAALIEVNKARHERAVHPGLNVIAHPPDERPFLLAALPQPRVATKLQVSAVFFGLLCSALGTLLILILYARAG